MIAMTDGGLECGSRPFEQPEGLYSLARSSPDSRQLATEVLARVQAEGGSDSATLVAWSHVTDDPDPYPSHRRPPTGPPPKHDGGPASPRNG
jgi:hypothetical protein